MNLIKESCRMEGVSADTIRSVWARWGRESQARAFGALYFLWHGGPGPKNQRLVIRELQALARQRYAPAEFALALAYYEGRSVQKDYVSALRLCRQAADRGYPSAQGLMGDFFTTATPQVGGGEPNPTEARRWWTLAARQGNPRALCHLAFRELREGGVEDAYVWATLAIRCAGKRYYPAAEGARGHAAALLDWEERNNVQERVREEGRGLPRLDSDHETYWEVCARHSLARVEGEKRSGTPKAAVAGAT